MGLNLEFEGVNPYKPHWARAIVSPLECLIPAGKGPFISFGIVSIMKKLPLGGIIYF